MTYRKAKLTQGVVNRAEPEAKRYVLTDTVIPGFWLVVEPSGRKSFRLRYRVGGGRKGTVREPKIGDANALKCETARDIARGWYAEVARGGDPGGERLSRRKGETMASLFARYLSDHAEKAKKASSVVNDRRLIETKLRPALGGRRVAEVTRAEIAKLHDSMSATPYEANRALALLSKAFNLAEVWGWRPDGSNPTRHVRRYAEKARKRYLSRAEFGRLGAALQDAEDGFVTLPPKPGVRDEAERCAVNPWAVTAIRLLILTGARKSEILSLRWGDIDAAAGRANLPDSKTGEKTVILPPPALAILERIPRSDDNPHVLQGAKPGAHLVNIDAPWRAIREAAGLDDVRVHDLRHSFASVGVGGGASLPMLGALLGHTQAETTQRYAHLADDPLQTAAARISFEIEKDLGGEDGG